MKIPIPLQIAVLAVALTGFYAMVGQAVPQKEVQPPEVIEVSTNVTTAELVAIGQGIFEGKGLCVTCHTIGKSGGALRFPDLAGIAERAATRIAGYTPLDYLAESLYEPDVFIVTGFNPGMPKINKPPIGLSDPEILAVIAYLQTLGGEATVTATTKTAYTGGTLGAVGGSGGGEGDAGMGAVIAAAGDEGVDAAAVARDEAPPSTGASAASPLISHNCNRCHGSSASSLDDVGTRGTAALLAAMAAHDAGGTDQLTLAEVKTLVAYLAAQGGQDG